MRALSMAAVLTLFLSGCGSPPPAPGSRAGIAWTSRNNTYLVLDRLPIKDYPALKKFHRLREVQFTHRTATDEKMEALARVGLTHLYCVTMNGSSYITDRGIEALAGIPTVHSLGLEGASITDAGLDLIASRMQPESVNVASCSNITINGLLKLVRTDTLTDIAFSADHLATADVVRLLESAQNLERFEITGPSNHLDKGAIYKAAGAKARARGRELRVVFQHKGSMFMDFPLPPKSKVHHATDNDAV